MSVAAVKEVSNAVLVKCDPLVDSGVSLCIYKTLGNYAEFNFVRLPDSSGFPNIKYFFGHFKNKEFLRGVQMRVFIDMHCGYRLGGI